MARTNKSRVPALAYLRTSSATNVGTDRDSEKRQRQAIESFARGAGFDVVDWYYDAAVSGADPVDARPGFAAALERIASNGVQTIIVETANRFARDLIVQETGFRMLRDQGIELIAADSPGSFIEDTPTAALIRQVLGAVAQFEKAALVAKLKGARERKRRHSGKCEGRKSFAEMAKGGGPRRLPADPRISGAMDLAKRLRRASPKTGERLSFRKISTKLAEAGYLNAVGQPYNAKSVRAMVMQQRAKSDASEIVEGAHFEVGM
ncbi:MAG: recombinase family protein [Hyphomicrobium sp.]